MNESSGIIISHGTVYIRDLRYHQVLLHFFFLLRTSIKAIVILAIILNSINKNSNRIHNTVKTLVLIVDYFPLYEIT